MIIVSSHLQAAAGRLYYNPQPTMRFLRFVPENNFRPYHWSEDRVSYLNRDDTLEYIKEKCRLDS